MPIYEYVCRVCGHELETIQSIRDNPLTACPACSEDSLRRKLSVAAFHLKGTGWYETDFKNKKSEDKKTKSDSEESKSPDSGDSSGKDSEKKSSDSDKTSKATESTT